MVITEYLSKFPYAIPIKSKTAEEIASGLFDYISLFGPPYEILSDQGKEFLNSVVESMLKMTGIEHRVTSAYHPRTNGLTEKFNHTLVKVLSKHAEQDPNWHKWIPFALLAYRSRVQSSTKMTPFELMFGRQMNYFDRWTDKADASEEAELIQRTNEIRYMIEKNEPEAKDNIEKAQRSQRETRDKRAKNVSFDELEPGTLVFIRTSKKMKERGGKLFPENRGPYTVEKRTSNGNYYLVTKTNRRLKQSYPLDQLEILPNTTPTESTNKDEIEEQEYEVEEIRGDRINKDTGIKEYYIKYKNYATCEWTKEHNIFAKRLISNYEKKKKLATQGF